jgi:hypothetical protein
VGPGIAFNQGQVRNYDDKEFQLRRDTVSTFAGGKAGNGQAGETTHASETAVGRKAQEQAKTGGSRDDNADAASGDASAKRGKSASSNAATENSLSREERTKPARAVGGVGDKNAAASGDNSRKDAADSRTASVDASPRGQSNEGRAGEPTDTNGIPAAGADILDYLGGLKFASARSDDRLSVAMVNLFTASAEPPPVTRRTIAPVPSAPTARPQSAQAAPAKALPQDRSWWNATVTTLKGLWSDLWSASASSSNEDKAELSSLPASVRGGIK